MTAFVWSRKLEDVNHFRIEMARLVAGVHAILSLGVLPAARRCGGSFVMQTEFLEAMTPAHRGSEFHFLLYFLPFSFSLFVLVFLFLVLRQFFSC
jgi:hypothetical protein